MNTNNARFPDMLLRKRVSSGHTMKSVCLTIRNRTNKRSPHAGNASGSINRAKLFRTCALLLLATFAVSSPVLAHDHPGYWHGESPAGHNPNWMAALPDDRRISELSIPGTHETMSRYAGDAVECQSMSLMQQLNSGIRALDIRLRHRNNGFLLYHGRFFQFAGFGPDVLAVARDFLIANPSETIFMRVKKECSGDFFSCSDEGNSRSFDVTFEAYRQFYDSYIWKNPTSTKNPTLGEVRGKIVILPQGFSAKGISYWFSSPEEQRDAPKGNPLLQDRYDLDTNWDLYDKWVNVRKHLLDAASGRNGDLYMNYLSAAIGSFPYFVASGHSSHQNGAPRLWTGLTTTFNDGFYTEFPRLSCVSFDFGLFDLGTACSIYFEGTNVMATNYINQGEVRGRVGMIMADFPGQGLIEAVISLNKARLITNTDDSGEGSLRWAIANSVAFDPDSTDEFTGGFVSFAPELSGQTILLNSEIVIDRDISIDGSTLDGGIAISGGGVTRVFYINNPQAHVKISGLTITGGHADGEGIDGFGGGIFSLGKSLEVTGCTLNDNFARRGSAIHQNRYDDEPEDGVLTIINSTIADNIAEVDASIFNSKSEMILEHSTVSNNRNNGDALGAGIVNFGTLKVINSIVAGNYNPQFLADIVGDFIATAPNIVEHHNLGTVTGIQPISADPLLGPLGPNDGPTKTMLPGVQSPALNAATWFSRLAKDQRGEQRPAKAGANPVIGAVEVPVGPTIQVYLQGGALIAAGGDTWSFGNVLPGMFGYLDFGIGNAGNATLSGLSITIDGPDAAMFTLLRSPSPQIDPQGATSFYVRFAPTSPGKKIAVLLIASNDPDQNPYKITLGGIGDSTFSTTRTTGGKPTWNRPDEERPPSVLSASATATPYDVVSFTVKDPGDYTVTSSVTNPGQWDNYLFLYNGVFDASAPLTNGLIGARGGLIDGVDRGVAGFTADLAPGIRYYLVTTGNTNSDYGDYTLKVTGPSDFEVFAPPAISAPMLSQTGVSAYPTFSWTSTPGATHEVFLGTDPGSLVSLGFHESPFTISPPLSHNTTYYWRLDSHQSGAVVSGGVQTFTTRTSIEVTTVLDENDGSLGLGAGDSLREAIAAAATGEASTIEFAAGLSGQTIRLGGSPLAIPTDLTIDGSSLPVGIKVSGNNASRVFEIAAGMTVTMDAVTITEGTVPDGENGAGILNEGTLTLVDTTLHGNRAHTGKGGGIHNLGILMLENSTISENDASHGGGIYNEGASSSATLTNVTVSGNTAADGGGGITNASDAGLTLIHNTVSENWASVGSGAGIEISSGSLAVENSIIAGNDAMKGRSSIYRTGGSITSGGVNIIGDNSSVATEFPAGPFVGTALNPLNPSLSPLDFFDGRTQTRPPLPGSPAFDAAVSTGLSPPRDQRGVSRPKGSASDIGAVESELSANADLASLKTSAGKLSPVFWPDVTGYSVSVAAGTASARVRASTENDQATAEVRINGGAFSALAMGTASSALPLNAGDNLIDIKVTAENGAEKTYMIAVNRGAPLATNTDLDTLAISSGSLNPAFTPAVTSYSTTLGNTTTSITVTPAAADPGATVEVAVNFGPASPVASGAVSSPLTLNIGSNLIAIRVTAKDATSKATHTLTVIREAPAFSNANLSALVTSAGALSPAFSREVFFYHVLVSEDVTSATVTPTSVQPAATIEVQANAGASNPVASGAASPPLALDGGVNLVEVKVTAEDGTTVNSYTIIVTRVIDDLEWVSKPGNDWSGNASISADCRYVAFSSRATNLVANDTNNSEDVFVYDRDADTIERVSVNKAGEQGEYSTLGRAHSRNPSISADGRYVAFQSSANNLVPNDNNGGQSNAEDGEDIFVFDRLLPFNDDNKIKRVSLRDNGSESLQSRAKNPSISADGRYVAFSSGANDLVSGFETHSNVNVYIHDRDVDSIVGIDVPFGDFRANRNSLNSAVSADGSFVAFELAVNRSEFPQYQYTDIYLYHRSNQTVERITGDYEGLPSDGNQSKAPSISADGRYIAFQSNINGIDFDDTNGANDVFVHDRMDGLTERVSVDSAGLNDGFNESTNPSISGDGRYVAFQSYISDFVPTDFNGDSDIFMKNLATGEISLLSVNSASVQGDFGSFSPSVSFDGRCVAFQSNATNLGSPDTNDTSDVFVAVTEVPAPSSLADLASLTSNIGALGTGFTPGSTSYTASVANEVTTAFLQPVTADPDATIAVRVNSGAFSPVGSDTTSSLALDVGLNAIHVKVTAPDGSTARTYLLEVTRAPSNDAKLSDLVLSDGTLTPTFLSGVKTYAAGVSNETTSLTVTPTVAQANASVTVNGEAVISGAAGSAISLDVGDNTISIVVTAEDNDTTNTYVLRVVREQSSNADLVSLVPNTGALTPAFDSRTTGYAIEVPNDTTSITVTPTTAQADAAITINGETVTSGTASSAINLYAGTNTISTFVTAQDGDRTRTYTLTVTISLRDDQQLIVTTLADENDAGLGLGSGDSLRETIAATLPGDTITFDPALSGQTITLGGTQLTIDKTLTIDASALDGGITIDGNNASGVFLIGDGGDATLNSLTVTGGFEGGGSFGAGFENNGSLTLINSTLSGNFAGFGGGGIFNRGSLTVANSTISGNDAEYGGAIYNNQGTLTLLNATISGNSADFGGGIFLEFNNLTLENTIVAGNTAAVNADIYKSAGTTVTTSGGNLIGDNSSVAAEFPIGPLAGDAANPLDPLLAPLANYGGATETMPPLLGSPAIDAAIATASSPATDQRGVLRPNGPAGDIGSVEGEVVFCEEDLDSDMDVDGSDLAGLVENPDSIGIGLAGFAAQFGKIGGCLE